jgi:predicted MPP superfamily phosphohydrolase
MVAVFKLIDLWYNILFLPVSVLVMTLLARKRVSIPLAIVTLGISGIIFAALLSRDYFHMMRNLAWLSFVYFPGCAVCVFILLRKSRKVVARVFLASAILFCVIAIDAFFIEPHWLVITRHTIQTNKLREPMRIVILSDIQADKVGSFEESVLRKGWELKPDLVVLPGDYIQLYGDKREAEVGRLRGLLQEISAPVKYGTWSVRGNVDPDDWPTLFEGTTIKAMDLTTNVSLNKDLHLTGLSFMDSHNPTLRVADREGFHIVFGHMPDFALGDIHADLLIAGHTHGGQVRLPLVGPLITMTKVPHAWTGGLTRLADDRHLVVSRGIGMERGFAPRLRFLCKPEIVVIDVVPE